MSWIDIVIKDATEAENRPVCDKMSLYEALDRKIEAHEDKNPISVRFPVFDHFIVLFGSHFQIH